jgi:hypothetical protein
MTEEERFAVEHFTRRRYTVEGSDLDKAKRIGVIVTVDGVKQIEMQAREPGIIAVVSRPAEQGFDIEIVEVDRDKVGVRYTDYRFPNGAFTEPVAEWQQLALDL